MSRSDLVALGVVVGISAFVILGARLAARRSRDPGALARGILVERWPLALVGAGAIIALTGLGMILHARYVTRVEIDLADVEQGARVDAELTSIAGFARPEARICRRTRGGESCYTPVTSTPGSSVVAALAAADLPAGRVRFAGFVTQSNQLDFRRRVEEAGLRPSPELFRVLPETRRERSVAGAVVALAGAGLLAVGWGWLRRLRARSG